MKSIRSIEHIMLNDKLFNNKLRKENLLALSSIVSGKILPSVALNKSHRSLLTILSTVMLGSGLLLSGCGQKGALYLPDAESVPAVIDQGKAAAVDEMEIQESDIVDETRLQQIINDPNDY